MGLKPNADDRHEGQIYNSEDGKNYDVSIWVDEPNALNVRGLPARLPVRLADLDPDDRRPAGQLTGPTNGAGGPSADPEWAPEILDPGCGEAACRGARRAQALSPGRRPSRPALPGRSAPGRGSGGDPGAPSATRAA